jgi:outer membrane protein TolC
MKWSLFLFLLLAAFGPAWAQTEKEAEVLTLQSAINSALKNNLDIEIAQYNPEISATDIIAQRAKFDPLFIANLNANDANQPTGSRLAGIGTINNTNVDYNFTLTQKLKTGTFYDVVFNNSRITTNQLFASFNPRYDSSLFANFTQPLLRNFGSDITLAPIRIAEKNRLAEDSRLRMRVLDVALQVEQTYWDLVFAQRELGVVKQSLIYAKDLYENNKKQVEVGTMAPLDVVVAEAEVASKEEGIITVEALIRNTEDRLKTLIGGKQIVNWDSPINPAEEPEVRPLQLSEDQVIQRALAENPDLKALAMDVESSSLNSKIMGNALKPQLDLKASVGFAGLGGEHLIFSQDLFNPVPIGTQPGGYSDALTTLFTNRTWSVGFLVGIPIGNRAAEAAYVRADLLQKQSQTILENARQQLILNIRTTMQNLQSDLKRLEAAKASRVLQEKKLDAERKKLNVGLSTNNVVLNFLDDLALAQSTELKATIDYVKDRAQLERYLGSNVKL